MKPTIPSIFAETIFIKDSCKDSQNKKQPKYLPAKSGFTKMEAFIQSLLTTKIEFSAFTEAMMLSHDERH